MFFGTINIINLQLVIETFIASILFALPVFNRRKYFVAYAIIFGLIGCTIGYFFPALYYVGNIPLTIFYWSFMYIFLMVLSFGYSLICFKMKPLNAVLISVASYLIHHINNMSADTINQAISLYENLNETAYEILKWSICIIVLFIVYFLFFLYYFKQKKENLSLIYDSKQITFFSTVVVSCTIIISSSFRIIYFQNDIKALFLVSCISNLATCIILAFFFFSILRHNKIQHELEIEKRLFDESKKQYELSKENIDSLNIKFHDLKYRVQMLSQNQKIEESDLKDIYQGLDVYESVVKTGNKPLDVVLTEYSLRCENNDIHFTSIADGKALNFMSPYDIYSLFGNAITNAIEAVTKIEDKEKRNISLVMKKKGNILTIELENYYLANTIKSSNGVFKTSKNDNFNHGYGIKSMENIVKKYEGSINIWPDGGIFHLTITFITPM